MIVKAVAGTLAPISWLAIAIGEATGRLETISKQLGRASSLADAMMGDRTPNHAARVAPLSQPNGIDRQLSQPARKGRTNWLDLNSTSEFVGVFWRLGTVFAMSRALARATGITLQIAKTIWTKVIVPFGQRIVAAAARMWRFILESEVFDVVVDGVGAIGAALLTLQGGLIAIGPAIARVLPYEVSRHWDTVKKETKRSGSLITEKATAFVRELREFGQWLDHEFYRPTDPVQAPSWYAAGTSGPKSGKNARLVSWHAVQPRIGMFLNNSRVNATAAMLAAPLLATPATAQLASVGLQYDVTRTASVVVNSSPTITIATSDCQDIEQRVLAALKQHRQALFDQFCSELQRRQRTLL